MPVHLHKLNIVEYRNCSELWTGNYHRLF